MKINPEQLKHLLEQNQKEKTGKGPADRSFQDILNKTIQPGEDSSPPVSPLKDTSQLYALQTELQTSNINQARPDDGHGQEIMHRLESVLDQWEKYSQSLKAPDLRNSFSILESIGHDLQNLQAELGQDSDSAPEVNSLLNELEVMTVTERIKLNRGDYH